MNCSCLINIPLRNRQGHTGQKDKEKKKIEPFTQRTCPSVHWVTFCFASTAAMSQYTGWLSYLFICFKMALFAHSSLHGSNCLDSFPQQNVLRKKKGHGNEPRWTQACAQWSKKETITKTGTKQRTGVGGRHTRNSVRSIFPNDSTCAPLLILNKSLSLGFHWVHCAGMVWFVFSAQVSEPCLPPQR